MEYKVIAAKSAKNIFKTFAPFVSSAVDIVLVALIHAVFLLMALFVVFTFN